MPADLALRGVIYSVPDEKVGEMRALGATVPTEEDYAREAAGRGTGSVKAAGESLFRGATLGFGEPLLRKVEADVTGQTREQAGEAIQMRKQANPGIDFAGQVAGNVGFTLLTGGTGAIAKAAQVGRLGRVALMAGEGGLWGLGSEVSEATLENRPVIAERAGQAMVAGALLGGGMEAGAQLIGKLGSATMKALGSKSASEGLNNAADAVERRILFKGQPDEFLETQGLQPHMQARMREHGVGVEVTPENVVKMENARASTSGKAIGEDLAQADAVLPLSGAEVPAAPTGPVRSRVAASALGDEAGTVQLPMNEGAQNRLKWAESLTKHLEEKFGEKASYQSTLKNVLGEVEFNAKNEKLNLQKLWDWQAEIFDKLTDADKTTAQFKVFNEAREFTRDWVTENASKAIPELADQIRKNAKDYAADSAVLKLLRKQMGKEQTSGIAGFSWRNAFWGGIAGEMVGGFPGRIVGSVLGGGGGIFTNHFLAQKGGAMAVNAMRALADSSLLTGMSKGLQSRWLMAIRMAPDVIAPFRGPIEAAFAGSHETALATHAHLAQGPNGADYLHALQYKPEGPDEMQQASERMAALHAIEQHSNQAAAAMDAAVGAFFGEKAGRPSSLGISLKDYDKKLAGVQSSDPLTALQKLPPELMNAAPTVMAEAVQTATRALQYLKAAAPKDPNQGLPKALQRPWKPSQADVERWLRRVEAVESPAKVVESLGKSSVTREHIETLAAVYPQLLGDLQLKLATRLSDYKGQLSYEKRVALSHVLGPAALGITPAQVALMQQTFQKASAPAAPASRRDGRQKVDQQKNLATQAQRLEGR